MAITLKDILPLIRDNSYTVISYKGTYYMVDEKAYDFVQARTFIRDLQYLSTDSDLYTNLLSKEVVKLYCGLVSSSYDDLDGLFIYLD